MPRIVTAAALESFEPEHRLRFAALSGHDLARSRCSGFWEDRTCTRRAKIPEVFQLNDRPVRGGVAIRRRSPPTPSSLFWIPIRTKVMLRASSVLTASIVRSYLDGDLPKGFRIFNPSLVARLERVKRNFKNSDDGGVHVGRDPSSA
jgi:hypothetical protein